MRIGIGCILILDIIIRGSDLEAHYSNSGVLPLSALFQYAWNEATFSFHTISGMWQIELLLFIAQGLFALLLIVGYKTKLASIASWLFILSVQNRNPMILQGGDDLLRLLLFWGMFLPWNKKYSIDSFINRRNSSDNRHLSLAGAGYIFLIGSLYFFSAMLKNGNEWNIDGTAIYYALSLDMIVLPIGKLLYPYPELLKFLTFSVYYTELLIAFFLFIPYKNNWARMFVISVLALLHIGFGASLFVGLFFLIGIVSIMGLIPSFIIDALETKVKTAKNFLLPRLARFLNMFMPVSQNINVTTNPLSKYNFIKEGILASVIVYSILWNVNNLKNPTLKLEASAKLPGYIFRLDQNWGMFAPSVFKDDGWFILEADNGEKQKIDIKNGGRQVSYLKPESVVSTYKNDRWRKYSENFLFISNNFMRPYYCNYYMRKWNEAHPHRKIKTLDIVFMKESTLPDYKVPSVKKEILCSCGK